ncbi:MAG: hypothetical protein HRU15_06580, partial [Planctomycetes bacterium]|nr:hypothetical protein [Planctomycetota bacterium]
MTSHKIFTCISLCMIITALFTMTQTAHAAVYYIDYEQGDDQADGLSTKKAWKHAPGDSNAQGNAQAVTLVGGDTLLFKGGVAYRGSIEISISGADGKPIRLDGNSGDTFGTG